MSVTRGLSRRERSRDWAAKVGERKTGKNHRCATQKKSILAPMPPRAVLKAKLVSRDLIRSEVARKLRSIRLKVTEYHDFTKELFKFLKQIIFTSSCFSLTLSSSSDTCCAEPIKAEMVLRKT